MADKKREKTGGRTKGTPNRVDAALRAQFEFFLTHACDDIVDLFDRIKKDNPKQALDAIKDYAEFVLPKLARTEHQSLDEYGNPAKPNNVINVYIDGEKDV